MNASNLALRACILRHAHGIRALVAGYGEPGFLASYLGVQAHGILWPAAGAPAPAIWPITPPMVSAKVRMLLR